MLRFIVILLTLGALLGLAAWLIPDDAVRHMLQFTILIDAIMLLFAVPIALLQWLAPANPDGSPRT